MWSRNAQADTKAKLPGWGFSGSPLVTDSAVIVAAAGSLVAYNIENGNPLWYGPKDNNGYSSPHLFNIEGIPQILLLNGKGVTSFSPDKGTQLWKHTFEANVPIVQPSITSDGDVLVSDGGQSGLRRIDVARESGGWSAKELWVSIGLKPYFNDYVVHNGHAYGFDGAYLSCVDLKNGERKWKGGKYGHGQMLLLKDQDVLLIVSEKGELALARAVPDQFTELGKHPAITGKTWNHPVLAGNVLLVRNGQEMAAFKLAPGK